MKSKQFIEKEKSQRDGFDELISVGKILYRRRLVILTVTLLFGAFGAMYVYFKPVKPSNYIASALIELGGYRTGLEGIAPFEASADLAKIVTVATGVKAQVPSGGLMLIELEAKNTDSRTAKEVLNNAIEFIVERHKQVGKVLGEDRVVRQSLLVGKPKIEKEIINSNAFGMVLVSSVAGFTLSILLILFMHAINARRAMDNH